MWLLLHINFYRMAAPQISKSGEQKLGLSARIVGGNVITQGHLRGMCEHALLKDPQRSFPPKKYPKKPLKEPNRVAFRGGKGYYGQH